MNLVHLAWKYLKEFPEFIPAAISALTVLVLGVPLYLGMWYFLRRRKMAFPLRLQFACAGSFLLFAGLAFISNSPLSGKIPGIVMNAYLFIACGMVSYTLVPLVDVLVIDYYLISRKKMYFSPPLRGVINFLVFIISFLPIMRYMLRFNPFALIAIPTIATAGIALALQDTFKAFFAGIGLGRMIRIGDWIVFQDKEGSVLNINWGRTILRTIQGDQLFIPNTLLLTQPFYNYSSHHAHRLTLKTGVAYSASPERVKAVLERCAQNLPDILDIPKPTAQVLSFEQATIDYGVFFWVSDYGRRYQTYDALATRVWEAFRQEGFEFPAPFPYKPIDPRSGPAKAL
jgi:small-conductance mechanosensitive channel